ncbi:MAG: NAD(P)-dependent oxidoreductase [Bdellovibrionaceae bacterium]|nr:NAD(P)-dependent oxidoreductase [Pseudobdellovibrionaceae bacterium]
MEQFYRKYWEAGDGLWTQLQDKTIFVTGGTGFFGKSLVAFFHALRKNHDLNVNLTILSRDPSQAIAQHSDLFNTPWIKFQQGEVSKLEHIKQKYDFFLHFASPTLVTNDPRKNRELFDTNVEGTKNILSLARNSPASKILFSSSGAVYGPQPTDLTHVPETYLGAPPTHLITSAYGEAKRVAELLGALSSREFGIEFKIARCFAFVGPHLDPSGVFAIGNFISDAVQGRRILVRGDGTPFRSYLYADDLCLWLLKILIDGENATPYNVGSDVDLSIAELARLIADEVAPQIEVEITTPRSNANAPSRYVPSVKKVRNELGLEVLTQLKEAIAITAKAYKKNIVNLNERPKAAF